VVVTKRTRFAVVFLLAFASSWALAVSAAQAVDFVGVNDMQPNSGVTVNATKSYISVNDFYDPTNNTWLYRLLVKRASERAQIGVGNSAGNTYSACPGNWQTSDTYGFWEWSSSSTSDCGLFTIHLSGFGAEVGRVSTSSDQWAMIESGTTRQTSGALFQTLTDVYAGGYIYTSTTNTLDASYLSSFPWQRSAQAENQSQSWTTIQSSQQIVESHWGVQQPPSTFDVSYN